MPTYKLTLEYDGTGFCGWQKQPGRRTVQGELERALKKLARRPVAVTGAGRTDSGVHAAGQTASARLEWKGAPERLAGALNAMLPADAAVTAAEERPAGFDARRDARERRYRYLILRSAVRSPLLGGRAWVVRHPLDVAAMRRAAALFRGRRDFSAFCTADSRAAGTVRRLSRCSLGSAGAAVWLDVWCRSFLRRMVRMIAGAVVAAGGGRLAASEIRRALKGGRTRPVADAAPPQGLTLVKVTYGREKGAGRRERNSRPVCLV